tara:strand:+ start:85 stop:996 length:912 start_codon:yes stop_codon:yes gene_type:complete
MATDFENLKTSRSNFETLTKELEKSINATEKSTFQDDRFWKPELDKSGNGYAVLRFLPSPKTEEMPYVRVWSHAFKGQGGWYIENSLTTLSKKDPVSEENTRLWNTGVEADKETARKRKRKLSYFSNIYVVSDSLHPENEGKVFLFKYGKKIFDKVTEAINPAFKDEKAINVFDFWEGANFKLKIRKVDGYWNYDKSEFEGPSAVFDNDEAIEELWNKQFPLKPFLAPENFKSYDELKTKLDRVLSGVRNTGTVEDVAIPPATETSVPNVAETVSSPSTPTTTTDDDSDETLSYFSKLAEEDE